MNMKPEDIALMHGIQLELLEEVARICTKCNIQYSIIAGTLLGAVRHGGFIPWDKDADIAMMRKEYDRFAQACNTHLNHTLFYFQDHRNTQGYRWGYGKLRKKKTVVLREGQEHMPYGSGVGIDIFPLDHVPQGALPQKIHNGLSAILRKFTWCNMGKTAESDPKLRLLYTIMDKIPEKTVKNTLEQWIRRSNRKETPFVRILMFPTMTAYPYYYKKWYTDLAPISFEGVEFMGAREYEDYLTFKFGDYMTPPPKKEQVVAQNSYWSFESETIPPKVKKKIQENRRKQKDSITITIEYNTK